MTTPNGQTEAQWKIQREVNRLALAALLTSVLAVIELVMASSAHTVTVAGLLVGGGLVALAASVLLWGLMVHAHRDLQRLDRG